MPDAGRALDVRRGDSVRRIEPLLEPLHVPVAIEFPTHLMEHAGAAESESLVESDRFGIGQGHTRQREVEVLTLVAQGSANKEIAHTLRLSEATVKSHLLHIFEKLGAADRTHAVTIAVRRGIIPLE